ncbi:MAG TPA: TIGR02301 family protein [Rhizobium sp.]|nr:TIGR02301 family protein [Rhizobium sp.]
MARFYLPNFPLLCVGVLGTVVATGQVQAQMQVPRDVQTSATPYDKQLNRLSEILGTVTYLRNLCAEQPEPQWRAAMEKLLTFDAGNEPARKEQLTAAYNRGYRAFGALHTSCSHRARSTETEYRAEGATLIKEMTNRFGN